MYQVTLQVSARKSEDIGFFANEEVAQHVAGTLSGYDDGENGPVSGTVTQIDIDMSASIEDYQAQQQKAAELSQRQQWAEFYEGLNDEQKTLMSKFGPASLTDA